MNPDAFGTNTEARQFKQSRRYNRNRHALGTALAVNARLVAGLVTPHGGILVFLYVPPHFVQCSVDFVARLAHPFSERFVLAESNHGRNDRDFNQ